MALTPHKLRVINRADCAKEASMRTTIIVLVAIALVSPSADLAAAPSETNDSASAQTQHADNILRKIAKPRKYANVNW